MKKITQVVCIGAGLLASALAPADTIRIGGTGAGLGILKTLADTYLAGHPGDRIAVLPSLGSSGGIKALDRGAVQLAVSSRDLNEAERAQGLRSQAFARTPFVFAVSVRSSVHETTLAQLVDIYAGRAAAWPDGTKIRLVLRPVTDGDSKMVRDMAPAMAHAKRLAEQRPGMLFALTDQDNQDNLEQIPGALGATSLGQILAERRRLRPLTLDGIRPTAQNLADGRYPYAKTLFLVTASDSPAVARGFVDFIHSPAGEHILAHHGYTTAP